MEPIPNHHHEDPVRMRRDYRIFLLGHWAYALVWLSGVWLVFLFWNPLGLWRFVLLCAFTVAWPKLRSLFMSYEKYIGTRRETIADLASRGIRVAGPPLESSKETK